MIDAQYFRRRAQTCLRLARTCFDLSVAKELRLMAEDFAAKAAEIESEDEDLTFIGSGHAATTGKAGHG